MQLARFEFSLETALRNKQKRIVFIHGVGNGKLKMELRQILEREVDEETHRELLDKLIAEI